MYKKQKKDYKQRNIEIGKNIYVSQTTNAGIQISDICVYFVPSWYILIQLTQNMYDLAYQSFLN